VALRVLLRALSSTAMSTLPVRLALPGSTVPGRAHPVTWPHAP